MNNIRYLSSVKKYFSFRTLEIPEISCNFAQRLLQLYGAHSFEN